ncbi:hypothetical protein CCACVL1_06871, partial [Corchorus capsularis]
LMKVVYFLQGGKEKHEKAMAECLIVKLLGRVLGYNTLIGKINQLWKLEGEYKVTDLDHDYFIIRFEKKVDYEHVLQEAWIIGGHYLIVRQRKPKFMTDSNKIERIIAWIRFPHIPLEYFNFIALKMGEKISRVIKVDNGSH